MMSTDVKTFCYNWALKPQVKLLGGFVEAREVAHEALAVEEVAHGALAVGVTLGKRRGSSHRTIVERCGHGQRLRPLALAMRRHDSDCGRGRHEMTSVALLRCNGSRTLPGLGGGSPRFRVTVAPPLPKRW